jgi:hypothetical protein
MAAQDYEQVTYNGVSGAQVGSSATEKVGFFGATPVVQAAITAVATATATTALNETKINRLYAALATLGLINTGG